MHSTAYRGQSWKQCRLDMAEHFYNTLMSGETVSDANLVMRAVDLFYEMGAEQLQVSQFETATKWLRRAFDFSQSNDDNLSPADLGEMKLNVLHALGMKLDARAMLCGD